MTNNAETSFEDQVAKILLLRSSPNGKLTKVEIIVNLTIPTVRRPRTEFINASTLMQSVICVDTRNE